MPSNSQSQQPHTTDRVKQLFCVPEGHRNTKEELLPHFYVEARVDFNDIRTGLRETVSLCRALEIYSDNADLLWAGDMIREVDPRSVVAAKPDCASLGRLPGFVDANFISRMEARFIEYLLSSFEAKVYRNFTLGIYSFSGESPEDFIRRCRELLDAPMRRELDRLRESFNRRMEQLTCKYLRDDDSDRLEEARVVSQNRDIFNRCSERIASFFVRAGLGPRPAAELPRRSPDAQELEERLLALQSEVQQEDSNLENSYADKARSIDEYIVHPNLKDIHFVRSCILWMPARAA